MASRGKKADRRPLPLLCRNYNKKCGCSREDCEHLHMCYYFLCRHCTDERCTREHTVNTPRNIVLLEELGYRGPEDIELVFVGMQRKMQGVALTVCSSYNSGVCEAPDCRRLHVCHRHVLDGCPLEDCDLSHSVTAGRHNLHVLRAADLADEPVASLTRQLAETLTAWPLKPAVCRNFNTKAAGCEGRCMRLHCCSAFVRGSCWYGDRCFRGHDLRDEHNQQVLLFFRCTESQVFAVHAPRAGGAVGTGGDRAEAPSAERETPRDDGGNMEGTGPDQGTHVGPLPGIGAGADRPDCPTEVQRLIDYLEQYRQQKIERDKRRKERQERLQRVLERRGREREGREEERIGRELLE